ncbi:GNAT family N-acetyltransferase [Methanosarcina sp. UBA5]|uniref:GNAT family N-acetyltransferase n=1 Tax=Methanosarcina sp. UBA5 TaxID=1915593 RepID=UPI0025E6F3DF|nr:N-acetyltransferase [Methanosarcina sp. UBA5]
MFIRRAKIEDANEASELICMAWEECAYVLAGSTNRTAVQEIIKKFYKQPDNILSYQNIDVAEGRNGIAGLVLSFPSDYFPRLKKLLVENLPKYYKSNAADFQRKVIPMLETKEAESGEYYIDSIAVYPQYRACGIGSKLLKVATLKSHKLGIYKTSLIVKPENKEALKLYKKNGYSVRGNLKHAGINFLSMVNAINRTGNSSS